MMLTGSSPSVEGPYISTLNYRVLEGYLQKVHIIQDPPLLNRLLFFNVAGTWLRYWVNKETFYFAFTIFSSPLFEI